LAPTPLDPAPTAEGASNQTLHPEWSLVPIVTSDNADGSFDMPDPPRGMTRDRRILAVVGGVTASSVLRTFEPGHHRCSTTGYGTRVVVKDGDDVSPGKDHSELEGELCGLVGGGQLALVGSSVGLLKEEVAPLLLNPRDFVVYASRLRSYLC